MTTSLVYHRPGAVGEVSPFDVAILNLVSGAEVDIACPYLSVQYLRRLIGLSQTWRLITDVDEWISSHEKARRGDIIGVLEEFRERIRNYPRLHAKVIVTPEGVLLGSANFTKSGILSKVEMDVVIDDTELIAQVRDWFQACWELARPVDPDEIKPRLDAWPSPSPRPPKPPPSGELLPDIAATLVSLPPPAPVLTAPPGDAPQETVPAPEATAVPTETGEPVEEEEEEDTHVREEWVRQLAALVRFRYSKQKINLATKASEYPTRLRLWIKDGHEAIPAFIIGWSKGDNITRQERTHRILAPRSFTGTDPVEGTVPVGELDTFPAKHVPLFQRIFRFGPFIARGTT